MEGERREEGERRQKGREEGGLTRCIGLWDKNGFPDYSSFFPAAPYLSVLLQ
jgi:hypothetical protein